MIRLTRLNPPLYVCAVLVLVARPHPIYAGMQRATFWDVPQPVQVLNERNLSMKVRHSNSTI